MLSVSPQEAALRDVRQHVLSGAARPGVTIDAQRLAKLMRAPRQTVQDALVTLVAEGLLDRREDGLIHVPHSSESVVTDRYAARCAIELGVAHQTVGRVPQSDLKTLRSLMEMTDAAIQAGCVVDIDRWIRVNGAFHAFMIGFSGSAALVQAYRSLELDRLDAQLLLEREPDRRLIKDHRELVDGYEAGDLSRVCAVIDVHSRRALQLRLR